LQSVTIFRELSTRLNVELRLARGK
jgi:hypothetical protein